MQKPCCRGWPKVWLAYLVGRCGLRLATIIRGVCRAHVRGWHRRQGGGSFLCAAWAAASCPVWRGRAESRRNPKRRSKSPTLRPARCTPKRMAVTRDRSIRRSGSRHARQEQALPEPALPLQLPAQASNGTADQVKHGSKGPSDRIHCNDAPRHAEFGDPSRTAWRLPYANARPTPKPWLAFTVLRHRAFVPQRDVNQPHPTSFV